MKAKNDLIQRERDLLKEENDMWKTKEQGWKTKENELKTKEHELSFEITRLKAKVQGTLGENKILKRVLQGKRVDRMSSEPWRWNSRVKRLLRHASAISQLSGSLMNF
ncbi:hypothetical protein TNIN_85801 [Trichonephila inaurata madagascariensis]|uniref:Uncharacterized protein n=1 Tax=Trichonephila inaurata madagascariensis TaxID=2747483 RepID=A0A8X7CLX4_9ARAC|nr:hypothetical protein TNIN_85801 [Trichonephila inaurata madagascariensis]